MRRGFKGIWIPKEIWLNKELSAIEKILLAEIDSLDNDNGCFASNDYFAEFLDLNVRGVQRYLKHLTELKYITIETDNITKQRYIKINKHSVADDDKNVICDDKNVAPITTKMSPIYNSIYNKDNINNTNVLFTAHETTNKKNTKKVKVFSDCLSLVYSKFDNEDLISWLKKYLTIRISKGLLVEQWELILDDFEKYVKNKGINQSIEKVKSCIAGGYLTLIAQWEKDNIANKKTFDTIDKSKVISYNDGEEDELAYDEDGNLMEF